MRKGADGRSHAALGDEKRKDKHKELEGEHAWSVPRMARRPVWLEWREGGRESRRQDWVGKGRGHREICSHLSLMVSLKGVENWHETSD